MLVFFLLRVVIALSLLLQSTILSLPVSAYAPTEEQIPARQADSEEPPVDEWPADEDWPPQEWPPVDEAPVEAPIETLHQPSLPAYVTLGLDRPTLGAGESVALTVRAYNDGAEPLADLLLTLTLPAGVVTEKGEVGLAQWSIPTLIAEQPFVEVVTLRLMEEQLAGDVVGQAQAELTMAGHAAAQAEIWLALTPGAKREESDLTTGGAVVQSELGEIVLMAAPGATETGVTFRFTELYDWRTALTTTQPVTAPAPTLVTTEAVTATEAVTSTARLVFLPVAASGDAGVMHGTQETETQHSEQSAAGAPAGEVQPPQPIPSRNVDAYQIWQLDAEQGAEVVKGFERPVRLVVSAKALIEQGVDPAQLDLWTRPHADELWTPLKAEYDEATHSFSAWLTHFSEFNLGAGLSEQGGILPSMRAFSVDRFGGGATMQIPIETPKGLGGLAPNLSLSYNSITVDDLHSAAGPNGYKTQSSGIGLGWNLNGVSYIARADGRLDNDVLYGHRHYVMVLNGQFVRLQWEDNAWRTDPAIFAHVFRTVGADTSGKDYPQWFITTADGTRYTFGSPNVSDTVFQSTTATATFAQKQDGGGYQRTAKEWYLTEVQDPLGNQMEFKYQAEEGSELGCVPSNRPDLQWYVRAIYPTEILWSKHSSGVGPHMRVQFTYDSADRVDYKVDGWGNNDCKQTKHALKNRLTSVAVQVKDTSNAWQTLRSYALNSSYNNGVTVSGYCSSNNNNCKRLLLDSVQLKGKSGGVFQTYSFEYNYGNIHASPNSIRLTAAHNGLGGHILYGYEVFHPKCSVCGGAGKDNRVAATLTQTSDDFGNVATVSYNYGPTSSSTSWAMVANSGEFLGFHTVEATTYALNSTSTVTRWEEYKTWQGTQSNPDPRRGRTQRIEVRNAAGGTVHARHSYTWNAYRRNYFNTGSCSSPADGWCSNSTTQNTHTDNGNVRYHTLWVRLDASSEWTSNAGQWTKYLYQAGAQNNVQFGNVTRVEEYSHPEANLDLSTWESRVSNSNVPLLRRTDTEYFPNTNPNIYIVDRPARVRVYTGGNVCMSEMRSVYDNVDGHFQTEPTQGVLKKNEQALSACSNTQSVGTHSSSWAVTRYAYNAYGNVTTVNRTGGSTALNDITTTVYDSFYKLFPIEQYKNNLPAGLPEYKERAQYYGVNGLGLGDSKAFWGAMQEHCGVNDICTRQSYDEFGRPVRRWSWVQRGAAWSSNAVAAILWTYHPPGSIASNQAAYIVREWRAPRCFGNFVRRHYNGLGQLLVEQRPDPQWETNTDGCGSGNLGQEIETYYRYNSLGAVDRMSAPKLMSRSGYQNRTADWTVGYTATSYDVLGRPTLVTAPNGEQTHYGYNGRMTHLYQRDRTKATNVAEGYRSIRWQQVNGLGHLEDVRALRYTGSAWTTLSSVLLTHNVLGQLTQVTHPASLGNTTLSYDMGGRKTAMNDPDLGNWSYAYDRQGKLITQTDACGNITTLSYDILQRLTGKSFTKGGNGACNTANVAYSVSYTYDANHSSGNPSRGQLTQVKYSDNSYEKNLQYWPTGLLQSELTKIKDGAPLGYTTTYTYDAYRRPAATTYPDGENVMVAYNSMGLPHTLHSNLAGYLVNGTTPSAGDNGVSYDLAGRVTQMRFPAGGNLWRTQKYAPFNQQSSDGGMLDAIYVGTTSNNSATDYNRLRLEYDYDSFANLKTLREGFNGGSVVTHDFTYDAYNRLLTAFGYSYAYDTAGRITSYEGTALGYDSVKKHAVNTVGGTDRYDYDANGNVKLRNKGLSSQQTLGWDVENHLLSTVATGLVESYDYNEHGIRIRKVSNGATTLYPFAHYEVDNGVIVKYYFFAGQRVAMKRGTGALTYLHGDHLSSTALSTTSSGAFDVGQGYRGYGNYRTGGSLPTEHRFTGQKLDIATGLMYYNARYYDRTVGHFISPDTLVPDPTSVWDYNRFGYARLNPLKYNDPTGHCASDRKLGDEPVPVAGSQDCWGLVDHILGLWDQDQSGYWQQRWVSQDNFRRYVAAAPSNDAAFMLNEIDLYWTSDTFLRWHAQNPTSLYSPERMNDPTCGGERACQAIVGAATRVTEYCEQVDCVGVGNDIVGVGSGALVVGSPLCGPGVAVCAGVGMYVGGASTAFGVGWTIYGYANEKATVADLAVTLPLAATALMTENPRVGLAMSVLQLVWDAFLAPDERW